MLPLLEALENKSLKNDSYAYFCKGILDCNELSNFNLSLKDILDTHLKYPEKIYLLEHYFLILFMKMLKHRHPSLKK